MVIDLLQNFPHQIDYKTELGGLHPSGVKPKHADRQFIASPPELRNKAKGMGQDDLKRSVKEKIYYRADATQATQNYWAIDHVSCICF